MEENDPKDFSKKKRQKSKEEIGEPPPNTSKMKDIKNSKIPRGIDQGKKSMLEGELNYVNEGKTNENGQKKIVIQKSNEGEDKLEEKLEGDSLGKKLVESGKKRDTEEVRRIERAELLQIAKETIEEEDKIFSFGTKKEKALEATKTRVMRSDIQKWLSTAKIGIDNKGSAVTREGIMENEQSRSGMEGSDGKKSGRRDVAIELEHEGITIHNCPEGKETPQMYYSRPGRAQTLNNRYDVLGESDHEDEDQEGNTVMPEGITYNKKYGSYSAAFRHEGRTHEIGVFGTAQMARTAQEWIYLMIRGLGDRGGERALNENDTIERSLAMVKLRSLHIMPHASVINNPEDP